MKSFNKVVGILCACALLTGSIAGCSGSTAASSSAAASSAADSGTASSAAASSEAAASVPAEKVELQVYCVGDAPSALDSISTKINELTQKDLNCTVKFNFLTWTDTDQKYDLLLSSGQNVDLIYTATWMNYNKYATKGAFMDLTDMLQKDAPDLYKFVGDDIWNESKTNGKIYTMPATYKEFTSEVLMFRQDLQEKLGLPVPNTVDNLEKYLLGVKKNDASIKTILPGSVLGVLSTLRGEGYEVNTNYGLRATYNEPDKLIDYWNTDEFVSDCKIAKKWADEGLWSKSALSETLDDTDTLFENGTLSCLAEGVNLEKYAGDLSKTLAAHSDWKVGAVRYGDISKVAVYTHPLQNGTAVPIASKNPDRALMFYQKLVLDKTYNQLSEYGILGTNYNVTSDGYYEQVGSDAAGFTREAMNGWAWRNPDFMLFPKEHSYSDEIFKDYETIAAASKWKGVNIAGAFAEDTSAYQSQSAALETVKAQYLNPLMYGLVTDVDSAVATFRQKAKEAGLEAIQKGFSDQWAAYCKAQGYTS